MKYLIFPILFLGILLSNCSKDVNNPAEQADGNIDFMLISDSDPLELDSSPVEIETQQAFLVDGLGPFLFWVLDLSEEQKQQLREICKGQREEFRGLRSHWADDRPSWDEIKEKRDSLRQVIYEKLLDILTEDQLKIIESVQEQLANGQYPTEVIEVRVAFLTEQLNLSANQQEKISGWLAEYGTQLLTARDTSENRDEFREAKKAILLELDTKIISILNEDQLQKYLKLKQRHNRRHRGMH
jgi:hypothetical protein